MARDPVCPHDSSQLSVPSTTAWHQTHGLLLTEKNVCDLGRGIHGLQSTCCIVRSTQVSVSRTPTKPGTLGPVCKATVPGMRWEMKMADSPGACGRANLTSTAANSASNNVGGKGGHWRLSFDLYTCMPTLILLPHTPTKKRLAKKEKRMCFFHLLLYNSLAPWDFHSCTRK